MYFTSKIEIDPSQITHIKRLKDDKPFNLLAKALSKKSSSKKVEMETFTVLSILAQIRDGLIQIGINNIIRLAINGFDFYIDKDEIENDLNYAIAKLDRVIDPLESERFNDIELVLEHADKDFKYYISIQILRKHKVGEYPIKIVCDGLIKEFYTKIFDESSIRDMLSNYFESQGEYDLFVSSLHGKFVEQSLKLQDTLSELINVDGVRLDHSKNLIRPLLQNNLRKINFNYEASPALHGYPGIINYFTYNLYWMELCAKNDILCKDFTLVDYEGIESLRFMSKSVITEESSIFDLKKEISKSDVENAEVLSEGFLSKSDKEEDKIRDKTQVEYREFDYDKLNTNEL